jgi:plasmid stabilization system protein ParE
VTDFELSRRARRDLLGHADALSDYSERAALDFIETMEAAFVQLEEFPESGSGRPELGPGIRALTRGMWVVLYSYRGGRIDIVRILDGRRRPPSVRDLGR